MGECYMKVKNTDLAIHNLKKALDYDATNKNAAEMLKRIEIK
jgi:Tfp pilus assembly protein PilF